MSLLITGATSDCFFFVVVVVKDDVLYMFFKIFIYLVTLDLSFNMQDLNLCCLLWILVVTRRIFDFLLWHAGSLIAACGI